MVIPTDGWFPILLTYIQTIAVSLLHGSIISKTLTLKSLRADSVDFNPRRQLERAYDVQNNDLVELRIAGGFELMRCCHPSKEVFFEVFLGIRELPQKHRFLMLGKDKGEGR